MHMARHVSHTVDIISKDYNSHNHSMKIAGGGDFYNTVYSTVSALPCCCRRSTEVDRGAICGISSPKRLETFTQTKKYPTKLSNSLQQVPPKEDRHYWVDPPTFQPKGDNIAMGSHLLLLNRSNSIVTRRQDDNGLRRAQESFSGAPMS